MEYKIIKSEDFISQKWKGGTTTELYIYPPLANYKFIDFDFRISTATVEIEESSFTKLPSVVRELMVLKGEIEIIHKNHYTKKLRAFDIDKFEGDWETSSKGKCVDFNLMTRHDTKGHLSSMLLEKEQNCKYSIQAKCKQLFVYCYKGELSIYLDSKNRWLNKGDLLVAETCDTPTISMLSKENSIIVIVEVYENKTGFSQK